jgi:hypothetical protein
MTSLYARRYGKIGQAGKNGSVEEKNVNQEQQKRVERSSESH